jgi:hypothetical protein
MNPRFVAAAAAALFLGTLPALDARADSPGPVPTSTPVILPTLAPNAHIDPYVRTGFDLVSGFVRRQLENAANRAEGQVTYYKRFDLQVRTGTNAYRNVHLHQGTTIDPRGEPIVPGDRIAVAGAANADGSLEATAITILH